MAQVTMLMSLNLDLNKKERLLIIKKKVNGQGLERMDLFTTRKFTKRESLKKVKVGIKKEKNIPTKKYLSKLHTQEE